MSATVMTNVGYKIRRTETEILNDLYELNRGHFRCLA